VAGERRRVVENKKVYLWADIQHFEIGLKKDGIAVGGGI
jgi:hypothetical protein